VSDWSERAGGSGLYDSNTGRATINSALDPVNVRVEYDDKVFEMRGDVFVVRGRVEKPEELRELLTSLMLSVPLLLNVDFGDAPYVVLVRGVLGGVPFRWELANAEFAFYFTTREQQEHYIRTAVERLRSFGGTRNRQVLAALHYFHKACRLLAAGSSPWEFMAEAILNFGKILTALFGEHPTESMNRARAGLRSLGYSDDDIERLFIAAMALRSHIDVGHVMISTLKESDLQAIYNYLAGAEHAFRELLQKVLESVATGRLTFPEVADLVAGPDKRRVVDRIVAVWGGPAGDAFNTRISTK
jgi:hypothetical protein